MHDKTWRHNGLSNLRFLIDAISPLDTSSPSSSYSSSTAKAKAKANATATANAQQSFVSLSLSSRTIDAVSRLRAVREGEGEGEGVGSSSICLAESALMTALGESGGICRVNDLRCDSNFHFHFLFFFYNSLISYVKVLCCVVYLYFV